MSDIISEMEPSCFLAMGSLGPVMAHFFLFQPQMSWLPMRRSTGREQWSLRVVFQGSQRVRVRAASCANESMIRSPPVRTSSGLSARLRRWWRHWATRRTRPRAGGGAGVGGGSPAMGRRAMRPEPSVNPRSPARAPALSTSRRFISMGMGCSEPPHQRPPHTLAEVGRECGAQTRPLRPPPWPTCRRGCRPCGGRRRRPSPCRSCG